MNMPNKTTAEKWRDFSEYIFSVSEKTRIAWKRYPDSILFGEIKTILAMNGLRTSQEQIFIATKIIKIYANNSESFSISKDSYSSDAGIGKFLHNRLKNRSNVDEEARKMLKVWLTCSTESFIEHLDRLVKFNKKSNDSLRINDLLYFLSYWENDQADKIIKISNGYYYSNIKNQQEKDTK